MKNYKAFLVYMTDDDLQVYDVAKGTVSALKKDGSGPSHPEVVIAHKESMRRVGHEELQQAFHDFAEKTNQQLQNKLEEIRKIVPGDEKGQVN
jgi:hypothetical protein